MREFRCRLPLFSHDQPAAVTDSCRAAVSALPDEVHICPDFGLAQSPTSTDRGYVDLYLNGTHNIGIELTCDGKERRQHVARFGLQGLYAPLKLRSWIVVDFRLSMPWTLTVVGNPHCIFVVFSEDFATAVIMQAGAEDEIFHLRQ